MLRTSLGLLLLMLIAWPLAAKERRCGWLDNPSPANIWLLDKEGEWAISLQGGKSADGVEHFTGFADDKMIKTNAEHGFGCACLTVDTEPKTWQIRKIYQFKALPLENCKADPALQWATKELFDFEEKESVTE